MKDIFVEVYNNRDHTIPSLMFIDKKNSKNCSIELILTILNIIDSMILLKTDNRRRII